MAGGKEGLPKETGGWQGSRDASCPPPPDLRGAATVKSYTYDAAGRTKTVASSAGTTTLNYDYEGRVTSIAYPGGGSNSFTYNGVDTRVGKADSMGASTYRRDDAGVTDPVLSDGAAVYTPGISQRRGTTTTYDLHDRLGTASKQTGASATLTATRTFDAFGLLVASTGAPKGPFGFAGGSGYQEDGDSGLKLLGHRYYDPSTGRFLTRDPAQDGRNWYAYCEANPLRKIDPTGRWSLSRWCFTGDGDASDDVYEAGIEQGAQTSKTWLKHFAIDNGVAAPAGAAVMGPFPKVVAKAVGFRVATMEGSSWATSGVRLGAQLALGLKPVAGFVKSNQPLLWLYYEVGVAWTATYQTFNDPDSMLPDK